VLNALELEQSFGWIEPKLKRRIRTGDPITQRAHHYLAVAVECIRVELERQMRTRTKAEPVELEQLTIEDIIAFKATLVSSHAILTRFWAV